MKTLPNPLDSTPIRLAARGRWLAILGELCPELEALAKPGRHHACPVHGGRDGFRLFRDADVSGGGICNSCGAKPDGFALLMWLRNWSFPVALAAVAQVLGGGSNFGPLSARPPVRNNDLNRQGTDQRIKALLRRTWTAASRWDAPESAPLRTYLRHRGLAPEALGGQLPLRFHSSLPYLEDGVYLGRYPAMLALMSDTEGRPATIHRTFLTAHGRKAPVSSPKKLMPHASDHSLIGGAVRLGPASSVLGIAEGIETALAVHQATGMAVWSALSCTLLERFVPPGNTERIVIWADRDENGAGQRSAEILQKKLEATGIQVSIRLPPGNGTDWLDVLNEDGIGVIQGLPALLAARMSNQTR
jgi:putative DNA primase/helicase